MSARPPAAEPSILLAGFDFDQLVADARASRLGAAFVQIAWLHLVIFGGCHFLYLTGDRASGHFVPLWCLDVAISAVIIRSRVAAMITLDSGLATRVWLRVWLTFLILCLTSASLNRVTGFEIDWFKISWSILGTFGFATLAWIFHLGFFVPAVQMSITALLIAAHPKYGYLFFGLSWFLTLQGLGLLIEKSHSVHRFAALLMRRDTVLVIKRRSGEA